MWGLQTGGGDKVSTVSLLGCSTSVALATGPTDEEEEEANELILLLRLQMVLGSVMRKKTEINMLLGCTLKAKCVRT